MVRNWRPNKPLELTPLRVERDRCDFESTFRLDRFLDLSMAAQLSGKALARYLIAQASHEAGCTTLPI